MTIPLRVLVVEDSEDDTLLLIHELRQGGYEPAWTRVDSARAMADALDGEWDLVLADYTLPGFGGPAALELLKARGSDLPLIMVSGIVGEETAVESLHAGARDFIPKDNLRRLLPAARRELAEAKSRAERRKAEDALRESDVTLRSFYDSAPVLMGIVELPGDDILHLYDNAATARFFRHPPGATEGKLATELGAPTPVIAEWRRRYLESGRREAGVHFEYEHPDPEGSRRLAVTVAPTGAGPTGAVRYCYVAEDVTERRLAETALRTAEKRYQMLVEHIPAITYIAAADEANSTLYISPQVERTLGISPAEWIAHPETWVRRLHEDDRQGVLDDLARTLARGELFKGQ